MFEEESLVEKLVPAIEEQIESPETPFVKLTYERLVKAGEEPEEAKMLMALCLADESNRMFVDQRSFDIQRYQELLDGLPDNLPE